MALDGPSYYSNSIQGIPGVGADVDVTATHSAPKYALGYLIERADGARFRYCQVSGAVNSGKLVGQTTASGGATYGAAVVIAPASAVAVAAEYPILPGQVGSHFVEVKIATIAANKYEGGYLVTTRGTGLGEVYRIIGNTATDTPATGNLRIQTYEAIKTALDVNTGLIIVPSLYTDVAATATTSPQVTGVLMSTTTAALFYAWVCVRGLVSCAEDNALAITAGHQITPSRITAGSYASIVSASTTVALSALASPIIGYSVTPAGSSSRLGAIYLQIE